MIAKYTEDKDLLVTGVNGKFETESWTVTGDFSFSNAERNNRWAAFHVGGLAGDDDLRHERR